MDEKITLDTLKQLKQQHQPISMLTCYDYATAVLLQEAQIDSILVGDSLSQVVLGYRTNLNATMDIMITLTAAVRRGAPKVYLIGDMPFLSYQVSQETAIINAGRFLTDAGCDCVKIEVNRCHLELVSRISAAGIPVMAHLGLRPQTIHQLGRFRAQGRTADQAWQLLNDVADMIEAGACAILLECVPASVTQVITQRSTVPVISCGSGPHADGQVLVIHDIMKLPGAVASRFAQSYADIGTQIRTAVSKYCDDVRHKRYPDDKHSYHMKPDEKKLFDDKIDLLDQK